jgi:hypothetical protein
MFLFLGTLYTFLLGCCHFSWGKILATRYFLLPSRRNGGGGGSLAGAFLGGLYSEGCDDDVDASEVVSEAAGEAYTAGESISLP